MSLFGDDLKPTKDEKVLEKPEDDDLLDVIIDFLEIRLPNPPIDPSGYPYPGEPEKEEDITHFRPTKKSGSLSIMPSSILEPSERTIPFLYDNLYNPGLGVFDDIGFTILSNDLNAISLNIDQFSERNKKEYLLLESVFINEYELSDLDNEILNMNSISFAVNVNIIEPNSLENILRIDALIEAKMIDLEISGFSEEEISRDLSMVNELNKILDFRLLVENILIVVDSNSKAS